MAAESADVEVLTADVAEARAMLDRATRPNVQTELRRVLEKLEHELAAAKAAGTPAVAAQAAKAAPAASTGTPASRPVPVVVRSAGPWTEITTFALDLGGYDGQHVTVDFRLKGVEQVPSENVTCHFTEASFDLKVIGLDGKNHRFVRTNLEKDIVPLESGVKVKKNHVVVTLQKVKGDYGYDHWTDLVAKGKRMPSATKKDADPSSSIMDMMKDLYDDGDDNMKKIIGEAMYKAKRGEKFDPKSDQPGMAGAAGGLDEMA